MSKHPYKIEDKEPCRSNIRPDFLSCSPFSRFAFPLPRLPVRDRVTASLNPIDGETTCNVQVSSDVSAPESVTSLILIAPCTSPAAVFDEPALIIQQDM